jgi:hypothetical protein
MLTVNWPDAHERIDLRARWSQPVVLARASTASCVVHCTQPLGLHCICVVIPLQVPFSELISRLFARKFAIDCYSILNNKIPTGPSRVNLYACCSPVPTEAAHGKNAQRHRQLSLSRYEVRNTQTDN